MLFAKPSTESQFGASYDQFGDAYSWPLASVDSLKHAMAKVKELGAEVEVTRDTIAHFEAEVMDKR